MRWESASGLFEDFLSSDYSSAGNVKQCSYSHRGLDIAIGA